MRAFFLALPLVMLTACALVSGLSDVRVCDGGCEPPTDVAADVVTEDAPACTTSCANVPAGWKLVGTGTATCPSRTARVALVTQPMAPSAGVCPCACGATPTTMPTCGTGLVGGSQGTNGCSTGMQLKTTGCYAPPFQILPAYLRVEGTIPAGGACGAADPTPVKTNITRTNVDACVPSDCGESLCSASGIRLCIATPGVAQCPAAFPMMQTWGTDVSASCSCGGCNLTASCTNQKVSFYGDVNCQNSLVASVTANSVCSAMADFGKFVAGYTFDQLLTAGCASAAQGTPVVDLVNKQTVCCKG